MRRSQRSEEQIIAIQGSRGGQADPRVVPRARLHRSDLPSPFEAVDDLRLVALDRVDTDIIVQHQTRGQKPSRGWNGRSPISSG
jgi:hypothetical protein